VSGRRVLWFVNKVPLAVAGDAGEPSVLAGWLDSYIEIMGDEAGVDLTVAFAGPPALAGESRVGGVTFIGLPTGEPESRFGRVIDRWRHTVAPPALLAAASRAVRDTGPDLVHVHGAEMCFGLAVRGCGVPTLLSIQGSPTVGRQLYLRGLDRHYLRSLSFADYLKGVGLVHDAASRRRQAAMEAVTMASVGHVAGRTEWDHRLASVMAPQAVYHHCDEPMRRPFHEAAWDAANAVPGRVVCITSGGYPGKGLGTLLRAVSLVRRARPETTLVLASVRPDTEHGRATMRRVRALGLGDCVTMMGEIDARTVAQELTRASVFVNPSHWENGSNTLSEAQLVGVPCIASCAGGMVTTADHGDAALLVQDGDAEAFAGAILSLMDDPDEAAQLGARGRALARVRHDPGRIRSQLLAAYDEILG
jgi:glycosyltransferase involved in cell wall biosynthesis